MTSTQWDQVIAALAGAFITILWRLIDRYLPDPNDRHPLPPAPEPPAPPMEGIAP